MNFFRVISDLLRFDRTNWTALVLCLFAAGIFWIFNALNKEYSTNLSLPLQVQFDESKFATAETIPATITVNVSGNGWELLRKNLGQKVPNITLLLERPSEVHRIAGSTLAPQVISQLGSLQLNFVVMDTLRLAIEQKFTRKIPLSADLTGLTFKRNMGRISPVSIVPDSILVNGPKSFIEALGDTLHISVSGTRIGSNYRESLEVIVDHGEFISRNPPVAEVMFEVGAMVEVLRSLRLSKLDQGLVFDRDSINCTFLIPQKHFELFQSDVTDLSLITPTVKLNKGDTVQILPALNGIPPYATLIHIDSIELRRHE